MFIHAFYSKRLFIRFSKCLFSEFISVYSANLFPFFRSVFCRSNAVEGAVWERCSYMYAHVRTCGKRRIMKLGLTHIYKIQIHLSKRDFCELFSGKKRFIKSLSIQKIFQKLLFYFKCQKSFVI
jgi:hypothetical protein